MCSSLLLQFLTWCFPLRFIQCWLPQVSGRILIRSSALQVRVKVYYYICLVSTSGCNWYGFGAMFFGCLSMVIHGSISLVRCLPIIQPYSVQRLSLRPTLLLLSLNVLYSGIFALGKESRSGKLQLKKVQNIFFFWQKSGLSLDSLELVWNLSRLIHNKPFPLGGSISEFSFGIWPTTSVGTLVVVVEFEPLQEVFTQPHRQNLKDGHDSKD